MLTEPIALYGHLWSIAHASLIFGSLLFVCSAQPGRSQTRGQWTTLSGSSMLTGWLDLLYGKPTIAVPATCPRLGTCGLEGVEGGYSLGLGAGL